MAKKGSSRKKIAAKAGAEPGQTADYRHKQEKRKNNPPAKIAAEGVVPVIPKAEYAYSPHRPPELRFAPVGEGDPLPIADRLPELLAASRERPLTADEAAALAEALRVHEPWLEWADKREQQRRGAFRVDPVALHIHERVSAQAILKVAARQDVERSLFADPEQEYHEAVQFYRHDIDWTNRLILGDSLQVMSSLARRESLAGKVQMIYMDPPYGIKFASNFQPEVGKRDVKDKDADLTREPEMVRAYRDTWHLGVHSYLSYVRDRLVVARELLAESGSLFLQIGDENLHRVRLLLDEVFGPQNLCGVITFKTTGGQSSALLSGSVDYLLWYARDKGEAKKRYEQPRSVKTGGSQASGQYNLLEPKDQPGLITTMSPGQADGAEPVPDSVSILAHDTVYSQGSPSDPDDLPFVWIGREFRPPANTHWKPGVLSGGMQRLARAARVMLIGQTPRYKRYVDDYPVFDLDNVWNDTARSGFSSKKQYIVETSTKVVERCLLMTTRPGDLVVDPTCGSGTTAVVAEQWGRRWITIDTSRVSVAIARQRLMTARFDHYRVKDTNNGVSGGVDPHPGFKYKTISHVTLGSIARNSRLDPIFAKHEPVLEDALAACNRALAGVKDSERERCAGLLAAKIAGEGWRGPTDADYRRWLLPGTTKGMIESALASAFAGTKKTATRKQIAKLVEAVPTPAEVGPSSVPSGNPGWEHWQVPFDTDADWPKGLREAVTAYRAAWRAKMDEVNACIAANADQEELVDQPEVVKGVVRVSGPFTVEAVQPPEMSLGDVVDADGKFEGAPQGLETPDSDEPGWEIRFVESGGDIEAKNAAAYLRKMYELIRDDGVRFPNNRQMVWASEDQGQALTPLFEDGRSDLLHAEGHWMEQGQAEPLGDRVAVAFGPQYGPVTAKMVEDLIRSANRAGYDALVIAAFSFDGPAQAVVDEAQHPKLKIHMAHIAPDVNPGMEGLLKDPAKQKGGAKKSAAASQQLFSVFGQPRVSLVGPDGEGEFVVRMEGVDIYDPVKNTIEPTNAGKVAAWFLDSDYDGRTFCITQAFFPDRSAWEKLAKALGGVIDGERFEALSGTESLPFPKGKHGTAAVKVIDPRGNEVMKVVTL